MEEEAFRLLADAERDHWWFRGRREFIRAALERLELPSSASLLDAGCGSGGNLALLAEFGTVFGFEYQAQALGLASALGIGTVAPGSLPADVPFPGQRFDAIGLFDVLEHLPQPVESLTALGERLTSAGALVVTVPANPWMWGPHDEVHQHCRRYTARELRNHLARSNLRVEYLTYFNSLLLPLAIAQRVRERMFGYSAERVSPSPAVNSALLRIWRLERLWIPKRRFPFGLSLLAIARRRDAAE